jgi:hypothetical protein
MKSLLVIAIATLACTVTSMAQNIPSYIPTDGLVGWWPFNGNANDESGNGNDGVVNGATLTEDRSGEESTAYRLNGVDNFISISHSNIFDFTNQFSVSMWLRISSFSSGTTQFCINKSLDGDFSTYNWSLGVTQDGRCIIFHRAGGQLIEIMSTVPEILVNTWYNLILIYDGNNLLLYKNQELNIQSSISGNMTNNNFPISIGYFPPANNPPYGYYVEGILDDIAIWNRALTPQEISALYTASPTDNNETANTTTNVPGAISYQAVARDTQGAPLADTNVQVRFTLIADSLSGSEEYVETHTLSTNSLGLFTTAFGAGTPVSNTFENINWSAGHKFLNVQIDTGTGMVDMGTQQLLSTPYSLYSAKAGEIKNPGLPVFSDNAAALAGGLVAGDMYRTAAGDLKIVY